MNAVTQNTCSFQFWLKWQLYTLFNKHNAFKQIKTETHKNWSLNYAYLQPEKSENTFQFGLTVLLFSNSTIFSKGNAHEINQNALITKLSTCKKYFYQKSC